MQNIYRLLVVIIFSIAGNSASANNHSFWTQTFNNQINKSDKLNSKASHSSLYRLDLNSFSDNLNLDASNNVVLPLPNGDFSVFILSRSHVMAQSLSNKYPNIQTFTGYEIGNPQHKGRFDITMHGFHGVFNYNGDKVFIEPVNRDNNKIYHSYFRSDSQPISKDALGHRSEPKKDMFRLEQLKHSLKAKNVSKVSQIKTYRIAIATTGEYSEFHGGNKESTLASLVTLLNRVNEIYQNELGIKLELVANNDAIIFTDKDTDPFKNTDEDIDVISETINNTIGVDNYDIGHIVGTGGGGLAGFAVVCSQSKAEGVTGSNSPTGDAFHVDYVAHEIGHQFGADHTFNGSLGACEGNREALSAYEPGSASTIMGYAGICDEQNLQNNSDPYFHIRSIDQISQFSSQASCGASVVQSNQTPTIETLAEFTIPAKTAFMLSGEASDAENDSLSYSWEQYDLGVQTNSKLDDQTDDGTKPLFRNFTPKSTGVRVFPKIDDVLSGNIAFGETLPTTTRTLNFRLTVRDGQGNISDKAVKVNVIQSAAGFKINEPTNSSRWNNTINLVTWDTANSQQAPVSCSHVDILLSTDSGINFNQTLALNTLNDGSQEIEISGVNTTKARIKVMCNTNIFFAINNGDFEINGGTIVDSKPIFSSQKALQTNEDTSLEISLSDLIFEGNQSVDSVTLAGGSNYTFSGLTVTPNANFNGILNINATAKKGELLSDVFNIKVTVNSVNDFPIAQADFENVDKGSSENSIDVLANDSDVDSDTLELNSFEYTGAGSVVISDNKILYTPAADFTGVELIGYTLSDGNLGIGVGVLTITVVDKTVVEEVIIEEVKKSSGGNLSYILCIGLIFLIRRKWVLK